MKRLKSAGLSGMAMVALTAFVRVSSASASLHIRSCEGESGRTNCAAATTGTEVHAVGEEIKLSNGLIINTCNADLTAEVTNTSTSNESENLVAPVFNVVFKECNLAEVRTLNEPWTLTTNGSEFPGGKISEVEAALDVPLIGECRFGQDATHKVTGEWINADLSEVKLGGSVVRKSGSFLCGGEGTLTGKLVVVEVNDPEKPGATNAIIDKP